MRISISNPPIPGIRGTPTIMQNRQTLRLGNIDRSEVNRRRSKSLIAYWKDAVERRRRLSERMMGDNNIAKKGEVRERISDAKRGRRVQHSGPLSERQLQHLKKVAKAKVGKPLPLEVRIKISQSKRGRGCGESNPFFGKSHSEEFLQSQSERMKALWREAVKGQQLCFKDERKVERALEDAILSREAVKATPKRELLQQDQPNTIKDLERP